MKESEPVIFMIHTMIENSAPRPQLYQQVRVWITWLCSSPSCDGSASLFLHLDAPPPHAPIPWRFRFPHIPLVFVVVVVFRFESESGVSMAWVNPAAAGANVSLISNDFIHHASIHVLTGFQSVCCPLCDLYKDKCVWVDLIQTNIDFCAIFEKKFL